MFWFTDELEKHASTSHRKSFSTSSSSSQPPSPTVLPYCWSAGTTNQPSANRLFFFFSCRNLRRTWNYSAGPHRGDEIRVNGKARDNPNVNIHFFFLATLTHLCASHSCDVFSAAVTAPNLELCSISALQPPPSLLLPPAPSSESLRPLKFPGDFISPVSNRIAAQFAMPRVTLCFTIPLLIRTRHYKKREKNLQIEQNVICQKFILLPAAICHFFLFDTCFLRDALTECSAPRRWPDGSVRQAKMPQADRREAGEADSRRIATDSSY